VTGEIVGQSGKKILVFKRSGAKATAQRGHRQYQTTLKITAIEA